MISGEVIVHCISIVVCREYIKCVMTSDTKTGFSSIRRMGKLLNDIIHNSVGTNRDHFLGLQHIFTLLFTPLLCAVK